MIAPAGDNTGIATKHLFYDLLWTRIKAHMTIVVVGNKIGDEHRRSQVGCEVSHPDICETVKVLTVGNHLSKLALPTDLRPRRTTHFSLTCDISGFAF